MISTTCPSDMIFDVEQFLKACSQEPSHKTVSLYHDLVKEEIGELEDAMASFNAAETETEIIQAKADALDAICDSIWVLIGLSQMMELPLERGWDEVAISNLRKIDAELGLVSRDENGKILKPDGWRPPDMVRIIKSDYRQAAAILRSEAPSINE